MGNDEFEDITSGPLGDTRAGRSVAWGDFDNDGDLDIYLVNNGSANKLFRNDGGETFVDDTPSPLADPGTGSGMAIADYDGDGFLDIYQADFGGPNKLFKNETANGNNWLKVKLSRGSSALGIGSRVTVKVGGATYIREISGGSGFLSQNSQIAHFGLGDATLVDLVEVVWPNGLRQTAESVGVNDEVVFEEVLVEDLPRPGQVDLEIVPDTPYLIVSWTPPVIPDAPVISGLLVTVAGDCELSDGTPATIMKFSLTYTDPNGDVDDASQVRIYPGAIITGS